MNSAEDFEQAEVDADEYAASTASVVAARNLPPPGYYMKCAQHAGSVTTGPADTVDKAYALARMVAESSMLPKGVNGWADLLLMFLYGAQMGLSPLESLAGVNVIEGRPGLYAKYQLASLKRHGVKVRWVKDGTEGIDEGLAYAELEMLLPDDPDLWHLCRYSLEEAKRAKLWPVSADKERSSAWAKHPSAMLRARCITKACSMHAPHLMGMHSAEELLEALEAETIDAPRLESGLVRAARADVGDETMDAAIQARQADRSEYEAWWSKHGQKLRDQRDKIANTIQNGTTAEKFTVGKKTEEFLDGFISNHAKVIDAMPGHVKERQKTWDWLRKVAMAADYDADFVKEIFKRHGVWQNGNGAQGAEGETA